MRIGTYGILGMLALNVGCASAEDDAKAICGFANDAIAADPTYTGQAKAFAAKLTTFAPKHAQVQKLLPALAVLNPHEGPIMARAGLMEAVGPDYQCEALTRLSRAGQLQKVCAEAPRVLARKGLIRDDIEAARRAFFDKTRAHLATSRLFLTAADVAAAQKLLDEETLDPAVWQSTIKTLTGSEPDCSGLAPLHAPPPSPDAVKDDAQ